MEFTTILLIMASILGVQIIVFMVILFIKHYKNIPPYDFNSDAKVNEEEGLEELIYDYERVNEKKTESNKKRKIFIVIVSLTAIAIIATIILFGHYILDFILNYIGWIGWAIGIAGLIIILILIISNWEKIKDILNNLFAKDSKYAHYLWYTFSGILFLIGTYFATINKLFIVFPLIILGCLCYTIGKNHFNAQEFINLEDNSELNEFWEMNHSWKERGIYKLYVMASFVWIIFLITKLVKMMEVIK